MFGSIEAGDAKFVLAVGNEFEISKTIEIKIENPQITLQKVVDFFQANKVKAISLTSFWQIELDLNAKNYGFITSTPKEAWQNVNILGELQKALKVPFYFTTDGNQDVFSNFVLAKQAFENSQQPLFLEPVFQNKIWGGRNLASEFNFDIPQGSVGEAWLISAHKNGISKIKDGNFANIGLDMLYQNKPELFNFPQNKTFPLLTKILDAQDWLSVQVHPEDEYGLKNEGELGKTECWYILKAEDNAEIIYGHKAKDKEQLINLIEKQQWSDLFQKVAVKKGNFFFVPAGTIHAIGKGIMILEVQQSSDTTYRIYDFDRLENGKQRDLHLTQTIDVVKVPSIEPLNDFVVENIKNATITTLTKNEFFTVQKLDIKGFAKFINDKNYLLFSVISGAGSLIVGSEKYQLIKGDSFILPSLAKNYAFDGELEIVLHYS